MKNIAKQSEWVHCSELDEKDPLFEVTISVFKCKKCGAIVQTEAPFGNQINYPIDNFCFNCGKKMN